ncbi:uncharacterized protein sertad4 isoform X3 [Girardinichthys multiradiatus]|nr:uncharacterized protein sertad4 isoform X3 [Girardinichthys multiradiatus]XP_047200635.1 uncharacterized protein sertad4 isoform X3 [Girardinichthys multiradiatus]XP_047200636.1 uncharacterized protein sertad4 isoform X3 [Girardinichthys multiradiatus]
MTLVLSMNPFLDPDSDRCIQTCQSNPDPPCSSEERHAQGPDSIMSLLRHLAKSTESFLNKKLPVEELLTRFPCQGLPTSRGSLLTMMKSLPLASGPTARHVLHHSPHLSAPLLSVPCIICLGLQDSSQFTPVTSQQVAPGLEERAHVLRVSLEKMRFIDDPEVFLRRSVLVNNLLRRLRAEILLQSADWCFPPNAALASAPCILPPSAGSAHQLLHRAVPARICLPPQAGPPLRKRFRMVRVGQGDFRPDCAQTCCCVYAAAAAGHYLHLPFSMYDAALSTCSSTPSTSLLQLAGHSKLGLTVAVDDEAEEDAEEEEEDNEEEEGEREALEDDEPRQERASAAVQDRLSHKSRTKTVPSHKDMRTDDSSMAETVEEEGEQEEEEEEEQVVGPCSCSSERDLHRFSFWHRRTHRQ